MKITPPRSSIAPAARDVLLQLLSDAHDVLLARLRERPLDGAAAALVTAATLAADVSAEPLEMLIRTARIAWRGAIKAVELPISFEKLTVRETPTAAEQEAAEALAQLCLGRLGEHVDALGAAALLLQLAASWAAASYAVTEGRFVEAARHAEERRRGWLEVATESEAA